MYPKGSAWHGADGAVSRMDASGPFVAQKLPTGGNLVRIPHAREFRWREIAGEDRAIVEQERDAMIGVPGRVDDFAGDAEPGEQVAALVAGDDAIPVECDLGVVVVRLRPLLHQRKMRKLEIDHEESHTGELEILGEPGVVDVKVGGEAVANFLERNSPAAEIGLHLSHRAGPTQIDH